MNGESEVNAVFAISSHEIVPIPMKITTRVEVQVERDPRAMNRMDPETKLVHAYLEQWGRETKDRPENGFPASTLLGRLIDQGPMGASQSGRPPTDLTPQSALIDAAVSRLWGIGKKCIKRYYQTWEPMDVMARKESISESHMKEVLRRSRHLIALWLEDARKV